MSSVGGGGGQAWGALGSFSFSSTGGDFTDEGFVSIEEPI